MLKEEIQKVATKNSKNVINDRRYLHAHPELSFEEFNTAAFVQSKLDKMKIPWSSVATTGIVAIIKGDKPSGEVVALRADMDALPIAEENDVKYRSMNEGVMHACGHDFHTASLLGTAFILQSLKIKFSGTIKLIFQPGEEKLPGGASLMIKSGVLRNPKPGAILGQHVTPVLEAGKIGICEGAFMASMDELFVTVKGRGGHGAQPQDNIDPVLISSHIIVALQQIVSRAAHPGNPTVLSFGKVIANGAINVIPNEVLMEGTFRAMNEEWRTRAHHLIVKMAKGIAESMGGTCEFKIKKGYPFLSNELQLAAEVKTYAQDYLGKENVQSMGVWMAAEDFAYYSQAADACFYVVGIGNKKKGITSSLHSPTFNVDENALKVSAGLMAYLALKKLGN
ncbi:MAG: M20 family metallopeptidase [Ginsengibacter sp.]